MQNWVRFLSVSCLRVVGMQYVILIGNIICFCIFSFHFFRFSYVFFKLLYFFLSFTLRNFFGRCQPGNQEDLFCFVYFCRLLCFLLAKKFHLFLCKTATNKKRLSWLEQDKKHTSDTFLLLSIFTLYHQTKTSNRVSINIISNSEACSFSLENFTDGIGWE